MAKYFTLELWICQKVSCRNLSFNCLKKYLQALASLSVLEEPRKKKKSPMATWRRWK